MNIVDCLLDFKNEEKVELLINEQVADVTILRVITTELL